MAKGRAARRRVDTTATTGDDHWQTFRAEEDEDRRRWRRAIGIAVVFHLVLLVVNLPSFSASEEVAPPERKVYVMPVVRFKPPSFHEQEVPQRISRRVPVPDQTPDDPEPIRLEEPEEFALDRIDDLLPAIPDAAPEPVPDISRPIDVIGDVQKPVKLSTPPPQYTEIARRARIQGAVVVRAVIDDRGDVTEVEVLKSLPMGLSEAAEAAVRQWKFEPATLNGRPVAVYYMLTVIFELS